MMKTPVSILQEMMVKKQTVPTYDLIHDGGGTHINSFTYEVSCDGLRAVGSGRSKKDAKHEAAKAMLEVIASKNGYPQLPAPAQSPLRTPLPPVVPEIERLPPNVPFVNSVGALKEVCGENNLQEPEYIQISDVGPPHAKVFTFQCVLANFKEVGVARTKKQAKQEAAKKMLHKIIDLVDDLKSDDNTCEPPEEMPNLKINRATRKVDLGSKLVDYHNKIRTFFTDDVCNELVEKLESFIPQDECNVTKEFVQEIQSNLEKILSAADVELSHTPMSSTQQDTFVTILKINTCPEVAQIAFSDTEEKATFCAIKKLVYTLLFFLK